MKKVIPIYGVLDDYSAQEFISTLEQNSDSDVSLVINSDGGSPESTWGMIAMMQKHNGNINIDVHGKANSAALFMLCYSDNVECLDVSTFLIHRAAYPKWFESSENMTDALWENLDKINASLRAALESKVDEKVLIKLKGVTFDDIFSNDNRIDVFLDATEAKKLGIVKKINPITPEKSAQINSFLNKISAHYSVSNSTIKTENNQTNKKMTASELKEKHPEVYAQVFKEGQSQERERVGAWMAFVDVDPQAVATGIDGGEDLKPKMMAELTRKSFSKEALDGLAAASSAAVITPEPAAGAEDSKAKALIDFEAQIDAKLNLTPKQ